MRFFSIITISILAMSMPVSMAQDNVDVNPLSISVRDAIDLALMGNPDIKSFAKNIDLAAENIDLAKSGFRPDVDIVADITHRQSENDLTNDWQSNTQKSAGLNIAQPLFRGWQTQSDIQQNERILAATTHDFDSVIQDITVDIVTAYMATYTASEAMKVNADNVMLLENQLEATQARFDAGELTKTDVAQADARLAAAKAEMAEVSAIYEVALSSFRAVTGIKDDIELFYPNIDMVGIPSNLDDAITMGLNNHPDMMAIKARLDAEGFNIREQEGALYPQIDLNAGVDYTRDPPFGGQSGDEKSASVGITANIPLYQSGQLRNQIRQSKILSAQAVDNVESVRRGVRDDIIAAWEEYKAIQVQIDARESQLNATKLAYQGVELEEQVGARSVLDVLDANQELRDAELALIEAQGERVNAYYNLLSAIGDLHNLSWDKL